MKCLSLMVNQSKQNEILQLLRQLSEVNAYTIFHGEGHFSGNISPFESARDEVMGFVPRIRIDLLLQDSDVEKVLSQIKDCSSCASNAGAYWISPVEQLGDL